LRHEYVRRFNVCGWLIRRRRRTSVGNLSKSGGSFKIDHPLDPANKYLYHSFVESPDMKNVYDGTIVTDGGGHATVALPDWFEALNSDFRYQLTVIGQFAHAIVASEVNHNTFAIRTDKPNVEVSWQVTGIRQDAWANAHRIPVEAEKDKADQGHYLHPELFDHAGEPSIRTAPSPSEKAPAAVVFGRALRKTQPH
jgi:trimeric autotransporter adhesin